MTHYDVLIIGAGMSGLAAGIRLAYFGRSVCIVEKHYAFGGLNSYYKLEGREFDVGLHAVTNYVPPANTPAGAGLRNAPLNKLLRQLRINRDELDLCPQNYSEIRFPSRRLRFTNDIRALIDEVAREFPRATDDFQTLVCLIHDFDDTRLDQPHRSTRAVLAGLLHEPELIEMLLCPIMYYGSAEERDMDYTQFVTLFKSIFLEGFARPRGGVRTIVKALVRKYRECGGKIRMRCGVERLTLQGDRVTGIFLEGGERITADVVISSAGRWETARLCAGGTSVALARASTMATAAATLPSTDMDGEVGRFSFVETIAVLDELPRRLGHDATIVFFNDAPTFTYARPDDAVDLRSGVVCCPNNYERHEDQAEGLFRVTWLANPDPWLSADEARYREMKDACRKPFLECAARYLGGGVGGRIRFVDMFTPRTIRHFTGHINGAVYGAPRKVRDGRTPYSNLFLCGTDQGFLGIVGAMLSGITIANLHVLSKS